MPNRHITEAARAALEALAKRPKLSRLLEIGAQETLDVLSASTGRGERVLYQWRLVLVSDSAPALQFRPFRPGDEDAVLALNERAFAWHPEQGRWTREDVDALVSADGFDTEDLMVYEDDGRIIAFLHAWLADEPVPRCARLEVFAIDSDATGRGLGGQLSAAIVSHLLHRGAEVVVTYTEATNIPINLILVRWGGVVHRIERRRDEQPLATPSAAPREAQTPGAR